jgi:hypothetical protein
MFRNLQSMSDKDLERHEMMMKLIFIPSPPESEYDLCASDDEWVLT